MERDNELKRIARDFHDTFSNILEDIVQMADGKISNYVLESGEIITENTLESENQTNMLLESNINTNITKMEKNLKSGNIDVNPELLNKINTINKKTLLFVENLIYFKNDILNKVLSCKMFTANYPLLIQHIMNEAKMYHDLLSKVEAKSVFTTNDIYEQELFWNNIMKEHAEFIRGLLDPSEEKLILTADKFVDEYRNIIENYSNNPSYLTSTSLHETIHFRNFKITGEEGILNCKIKSIILPLLADHVVREANHFVRILKNFSI